VVASELFLSERRKGFVPVPMRGRLLITVGLAPLSLCEGNMDELPLGDGAVAVPPDGGVVAFRPYKPSIEPWASTSDGPNNPKTTSTTLVNVSISIGRPAIFRCGFAPEEAADSS
jgi:hypothetical protein